jgi:hypothetical protein
MYGPAGSVLRVGVSEAIGAAAQIARSRVAAAAPLQRAIVGWCGCCALRFAQVPAGGHLLEVEVVLQGVEHGVVNRAGPV